MAGPYASIASSAPNMPASVLEEELMDFENAATHFNTEEWALSELDEETLQGIVSGKPNTGRTQTVTCISICLIVQLSEKKLSCACRLCLTIKFMKTIRTYFLGLGDN